MTEKQPSQEPLDDGFELGSCGCEVCQDRKINGWIACEHCQLNPENEIYDE